MYIRFLHPARTKQLMLIFIFLVSICCQIAAADDKPFVQNINITSADDSLVLSAEVQNCFTEEMLEGVHNAIPVTFRFYIDLRQMHSYWFDGRILKLVVNHTLSYDPIKQEYQVAFSEKKQPKTTRSLDKAKKMMAELHSIPLVKLRQLASANIYVLYVKATLVENTLPLSIHSIIPFFSLWNFETDWQSVKFHY